ncbi:MAG: pilus assembly protein N-terminal domain-containing protein [Proteobacteria bacterium]|nr:pilus assembly protein N-terminal domain-containing protein [Pseudomonadota bacterium]
MKAHLHQSLIVLGLLSHAALAAAQVPAGQAPDAQPAVESSAPAEAVAQPQPSDPVADEAPVSNARATNASASRTTSTSHDAIEGPPLSLYHGEVQVLDLANVSRIAVGNGGVLQANVVASSQVVLIGQGAGSTSLRVWTRSGTQFHYEVTVRSFDVAQILRDVQDLLAGEPNISARQVDGHVLIEGDYTAARTATRLAALMKIYPQIVSTVAPHKEEVVVAQERMVYMDVRVVEVLKTAKRQLGINWQTGIPGPNVGVNFNATHNLARAAANSSVFGIATNLASSLDLMEAAGESWTLAEPTVSCKSGGEAKFTVGGEVPILTPNGLGTTTVTYKDYGIILQFKPVADNQGNISSTIVAEVSEPDQSLTNVGNNGLIAFKKTRTETVATLKEDQTLVLSGLLSNSGSHAANGIPGAKDIPVLGNLFKSKQFQNDRTELVVLVTPRSVAAQQQLMADGIRHADQLEAKVKPTINNINSKLAE